jgi:hypothetical protein
MAFKVTHARGSILGKHKPKPEPFGYPDFTFFEFNLHNWESNFIIENVWESDVTVARTEAEERWGLVDRPYRTVTIQFNGMGQEDTIKLWAAFQRLGTRPTFIPVYCDMFKLSADVTATATAIPGDFSLLRFHKGAKAVLVSWDVNRKPADLEFVEIVSSDETQIEFTPALQHEHKAGSRLYPLMLLEPNLSSEFTFLSRDFSRFSVSFDEAKGNSALPGWQSIGSDPDCATYQHIPIFNHYIDKTESIPLITYTRGGEKKRLGRGTVYALKGIRGRFGASVTSIALTRSNSVNLLKFLDSRQGRVRKFWFPNIYSLWTPTAINASYVVINSDLSEADIRLYLPYIALKLSDGTLRIRKVSEIQLTDTEEYTIYFDTDLDTVDVVLINILTVMPCYLVRLDQDVYTENWLTNHAVSVSFSVKELQNEKDIPIYNVDDLIDAIDPEDVSDIFFVGQAGTESLQPDLITPVSLDGEEVAEWGDKRGGSIARALITENPPFEQYYDYFPSGVVNYRAHNYASSNSSYRSGFSLNTLEPLHDNGLGLTFFAAMRLINPGHSDANEFILRYPNGSTDSDILLFTKTQLKLYEIEGEENEDFQVVFNNLGEDFSNWFVVAFIWQPGGFAHVYKNGLLWGRTPKSPYSMQRSLSYEAEFFKLSNNESDPRSTGDCGIVGTAIFRRALSLQEFNGVGTYMGTLLGINWGRVISFND